MTKKYCLIFNGLLCAGLSTAAWAQAPVLTSRVPAANAVTAPRNGAVQLTFSQPMSAATARPDAVRVLSEWRGKLPGSFSGAGTPTIAFQPATPLLPGETVRVDVTAAASSASGMAARPAAYQFTAGVQASAGLFPNPQEITVGSEPTSLQVADLNNDGKQDFVVANRNSGAGGNSFVSVRLGTGTGGFINAPDVPMSSVPDQVALGDLNNDGKLDMVVMHSGTASLFYIRLGDGLGGFSGTGRINASFSPSSFALGDINNDGKLDFLSTSGQSGTIKVQLGDGLGSFTPQLDVTMTQTPDNIALGDVNRDGNLDFLVSNFYNNSVSIRLGDGTGRFASSGLTYPVGTRPIGLTLADVNADGKLDFLCPVQGATTATGGVSIRLGTGTGSFSSGLPDVVTDPITRTPVVRDVNGDGHVDLLTPNITASTVSVRLGDGTGHFTGTLNVATNDYPSSLGLIDVDSDGNLDFLTANQGVINASGNTVSVRYGNGRGHFFGSLNVLTGAGPVRTAVADVNRDGWLDIVSANKTAASVSVRLGNGYGTFRTQPDITVATNPRDLVLGDVNNDGNPDLLTAHTSSSTVWLRLGDGQGGFAATGIATNAGTAPTSLALADVNHDGNLDLLGTNYGSNAVSVRLGSGGGSFSGSTTLSTGAATSPYGITVGDANEDGHPDLFVINSGVSANSITLFLGDGTGNFTGTPATNGGASPNSLDMGDVNNDGHLDAVIGEFQAYSVTVRLGTGQGGFGSTITVPMPDGSSDVKLGDVNGDGNLDLVATIFQRRVLRVLLGDGTGNFNSATAQTVKVGQYPDGVLLADMDSDGDLDIVASCELANYVAVRFNGAISAPLLSTRPGQSPLATTPALLCYPNPTSTGLLTVDLSAFAGRSVELSLWDALGRQVQQFRVAQPVATYGLALPATLPAGTYLLRVRADNGHSAAARIVRE